MGEQFLSESEISDIIVEAQADVDFMCESAWDYVNRLTKYVWTIEGRGGFASKSEKKRWLQNKAVIINGQSITWDAKITFDVTSIILFPNSHKKKITLL